MNKLSIQDLVNLAADAALAAAEADARAKALKAAAVAAAERLRSEGTGSDRFTSDQGLGQLRLDGLQNERIAIVAKPAELADWLAQRKPDLVVATINLPADQLAAALQHLEFAGITTTSAEVKPGPDTMKWLKDETKVRADPHSAGDFYVQWVNAENQAEQVPGVETYVKAPVWVMAPNKDLKKERETAAIEEARLDVAGDDQAAPPPVPAPRSPAAIGDQQKSWEYTTSMAALVLRNACSAAGLPTYGTKAQLVERLNGAL